MQQRQRIVYDRDQIRFQTLGGRDDYRYHRLEESMQSSTKDKAQGTLHQIKGTVKEVAGRITDNPKLEAEGQTEKVAGKVQGKIGEIKKVFES